MSVILRNIRIKCAQRHITLAELERKTKIGNGVIARWEKGNPRVDLLKKVADFFNVTIDELMKEDSA